MIVSRVETELGWASNETCVYFDVDSMNKEIYYNVDDILIINKNPKTFIAQLENVYVIKEGSVERPTCYLGSDIGQCNIHRIDRNYVVS